MACYTGSPSFINCAVMDNSGGSNGGGFNTSTTSLYLTNCSIVHNSATIGGGIKVFYSSLYMTNCTIITYSDIEIGWPGEGNIDADPRFCNLMTQCDPLNLGLASDSPCLGTGQAGADMGAHGEACDAPLENTPALLEVPSDYNTIAEALAASCDGDTLVIAPGTYQESELFVGSRAIGIRSWAPEDSAIVAATVIKGEHPEERILVFENAATPALVAGITISGSGQGLSCDKASPSIRRCRIVNNIVSSFDGSIYCHTCTPSFTDCLIAGNTNDSGPGGIRCTHAPATFTRCTIARNYSAKSGGGINCIAADACFTNCLITGNTSEQYGGGIASSFYGRPTFANCIIAENSSKMNGGGIYAEYSRPIFTNCVIANNSAAGYGDGINCSYGGDASLANCILWGSPNQINFADGYAPLISYSDIEGGWSGSGNINADPGFVSLRGFDYLLHPESPCIDAGDPTVEDGFSDWLPRWPDGYPNGSRADMGAYGGPCNGGWLRLECR